MSFLKEKLVFILIFIFTPLISSGQLFNPENFNFIVTPQTPGSNEEVVVSIQSFSVDLNRSNISWFLNSELQKSGPGESTLAIETGDLGTVENIRVEVDTGLRKISESISIRPTELDIVWEANTYAPIFYKGKRLYTKESYLNITAIPNFINSNGQRILENSLIYTWKLNGRTLQDKSGIGKNFVFIKGSLFGKNESVSVTVESADGNFINEKSVSINSVQPLMVFYQKDPLYGTLLNKSIESTFLMKGEEFSIFASPFFISGNNLSDNLISLSWLVNGQPTINQTNEPNTIVFRKNGSVGGLARISLQASHAENIVQSAEKEIMISF